jgi:hypothetical protein
VEKAQHLEDDITKAAGGEGCGRGGQTKNAETSRPRGCDDYLSTNDRKMGVEGEQKSFHRLASEFGITNQVQRQMKPHFAITLLRAREVQ